MKKFLALLLALLMALSIASCANTPEPAQSEAPSQADASSTGDASEPEQTGKKELTGTFEVALFSAKEATDTYWNELLDAFQAEYPDLEIKRIISPVIGDEIRPRWVDNTPPDLTYLQGASASDLSQLIDEKRFEPIDTFYETATVWGTEDLIKDKVVIESSQYDVDGKPIGFPVETGTYGFFYNQKLADELGITEMPKNYEEFIALGERFLTEFKDTGIAYIAYPGKNALGYLTNQWMQPLLCEQDPDGFLDAFGMKPGAWSSDWVKDCYKKILALRKYEMEGCIGLTHTEAQIAWLQGDAFLMPNGTWLEGEMLADTPDDFEMKMFAYPTMESEHDNISYVYVDSNMLIPKDAKNKDAAYEFIRFMYQDEWQQRYAELAKTNPGTKVSLEGVETSPMVASVADMISDPNSKIAQPKVGGYPVFRTEPKNWYKQNEMSMWLGEISVDEFFDTFEQKCEEDRQAEDFQELENYWIVSPE